MRNFLKKGLKEFLAASTIFFASSYVVIVVPLLLSSKGFDTDAVFTATIIASVATTLLCFFMTNLPFAFATGMSFNSYFVYTLLGEKELSPEEALFCCFAASLILLIFSITKIRLQFLLGIPKNIAIATSAGLGLFLCFIGLINGHFVKISSDLSLHFGSLNDPILLQSLLGLLVTIFLFIKNSPFSFLIGIITITLLFFFQQEPPFEWVYPGLKFTTPLFLKVKFFKFQMISSILGLILIAILDVGTCQKVIFSLLKKPFPPEKKDEKILWIDSLGSIFSAALGIPPQNLYIETSSGIKVGGKTRWTSFLFSVFMLSLFFIYPFIKLVPLHATSSVLICIGLLMLTTLRFLDFEDPQELLPAGLVLILTPLTFSISIAVSFGIILYVLLSFIKTPKEPLSKTTYFLSFICFLNFIFYML